MIVLNKQQFYRSLIMNKSSNSAFNNLPIDEWTMISQQRALEAQKLAQLKRLEQQEKKIKFKLDLDMQVRSKQEREDPNSQSQRAYFDYIQRKLQEQRDKQQREKYQRIQKRREIQEQNHKSIVAIKNSRHRMEEPEYNLNIGVKSEMMQKQRERRGRQQMLDTLDLQVKQKSIDHGYKRQSQMSDSFKIQSPNPARSKNYGQSSKIYEEYEQLLKNRQKSNDNFYNRITQEASKKMAKQHDNRLRMERQKKNALTNQMMQVLEVQVKSSQKRKQIQKVTNPQQCSFKFINPLFRDIPESYNKRQYSQELRRQAQQQKQRRKLDKYMSEQQLKLNLNRLNKIATGQYAHQEYLDRSMDNIGAAALQNTTVPQNSTNSSQLIIAELERLKKRRSGFFSRLEHSS